MSAIAMSSINTCFFNNSRFSLKFINNNIRRRRCVTHPRRKWRIIASSSASPGVDLTTLDSAISKVLPSLKEKNDEFMLRELVKRWENHKIMVRWLSRFFFYLDRYYISRRSLSSLHKVGWTRFRDLVFHELKGKITDAVINLIDLEREGGQIDRALLKNVLDIFVDIGMNNMEFYENDFEESMLKDTAEYYSRKASNWIVEDSCPDYMFNHVTNEGMVLVQQAEEHASNKAESAGSYQEEVFMTKVTELHDKYVIYVTDCFSNNSLFHKAMKEAFEVFCNKIVVGSSSAELLALHCDNILKKGGNEKLSDEAVEETLEKVVKVLSYINDKDLFAEFFRKKLSRRLLFDKSANDDHERLILSKLKQQIGAQFTSKWREL